MDRVIKVLIRTSLETILSEGGIGPLKLDQDRASACLYVVAVRNANGRVGEDGVGHRTAFMIARISDLLESGDRHILAFEEYAALSIPNAWERSGNPVAYTSLERIGIDLATLAWKPYPTH